METKGEIVSIKDETHDVKTFSILLDEDMQFIPGQYLIFSFEGESEERPFTFSNAITENKTIDITVKKMHEFTSRLFDSDIGTKVKIKGPFGEALNFNEDVKKDIVFLAGGSGITPFISAIRYAKKKNLSNKISLLYANKTEKDIIFKEELENFDINIHHIIEEKDGFIDKEKIEKYIESPKERLWYVCGPPPMVDSMENILDDINIPKENIRIEKWQISGKSG